MAQVMVRVMFRGPALASSALQHLAEQFRVRCWFRRATASWRATTTQAAPVVEPTLSGEYPVRWTVRPAVHLPNLTLRGRRAVMEAAVAAAEAQALQPASLPAPWGDEPEIL
jgi:hypothetical protein